jgi:hypothetical protein
MILSAHDLRRHIPRRTRRIPCVIELDNPTDTKVSDSYIPPGVKHKVLRLDVAMNDTVYMNVLQASDNTGHEEPSLNFAELLHLPYMTS